MPSINRREIGRLEKDLSNLDVWVRHLDTQIGNVYLNFFLDSFKREGFIDKKLEKWVKRKVSDTGRNLLVSSGRLRRSLKMQVKGKYVIFSTNVPYAEIHNKGGQVRTVQSVRPHTRKTKYGTVKVKGHKRKMNFKIPKRQFMGKSERANKRVILNLEKELRKVFK